MSRRRAPGPPKPERPERAPFDALAFKRDVQAKLLEATRGMTREEEREFFREAVRTGPLTEWWARAEARARTRAGARRSSEAPASPVATETRGGTKKVVMAKPIPIGNNPDFRALEAHAHARLGHFTRQAKQGSTSWIDPTIKPADATVKYKLMMYEEGIFFGVREEWAKSLGVAPAIIGSESRAPSPSTVEFRGDFVENNAAGRGRIDGIIALFPRATMARVSRRSGQDSENGAAASTAQHLEDKRKGDRKRGRS